MGIASLPLEIQLILVPTILFALTFHEYAHARVAYLLGDYTSYYQNRMNLNPFNHLDPFGTFALYFLGFGWAKPVPVVMQNLKNPRTDMMMIAMAGPASNMFLACLASIIYRLNFYFQLSEEVILYDLYGVKNLTLILLLLKRLQLNQVYLQQSFQHHPTLEFLN